MASTAHKGEHRKEVVHGDICRWIGDLPDYMEYSVADYKYLSVSMITTVPVMGSKNNSIPSV